ncbi:hypothetical protein AMECASPLE_025408 [Ameca splendens]|uniref:Uncharacterized protein n=1 Tax=Ameca splendens TaxID=208324 RepID=A0ABV0Y4X5_9TELE
MLSLESEGRTYWTSIGFSWCQSFYFLLSYGERAGGRVRGRYPHIRQLWLLAFSQKKGCTGFESETGQDLLKECSLLVSFIQFPVQGSHFVTQPWSRSLIQSLPLFFSVSHISPTAKGVS